MSSQTIHTSNPIIINRSPTANDRNTLHKLDTKLSQKFLLDGTSASEPVVAFQGDGKQNLEWEPKCEPERKMRGENGRIKHGITTRNSLPCTKTEVAI